MSIDMKSMDASWTTKDRKRVWGLVQALLRKCETALESALESLDDHVLYAEQKRQRIRLQLTYIRVLLACDDSSYFRGKG